MLYTVFNYLKILKGVNHESRIKWYYDGDIRGIGIA